MPSSRTIPLFKVIHAPGLKRGDLCAFSGYLGKIYVGLFWGTGEGTLQFVMLTNFNAEQIKYGKKPPIDYIGGNVVGERVVFLDPRSLEKEETDIYNEIKQYIK